MDVGSTLWWLVAEADITLRVIQRTRRQDGVVKSWRHGIYSDVYSQTVRLSYSYLLNPLLTCCHLMMFNRILLAQRRKTNHCRESATRLTKRDLQCCVSYAQTPLPMLPRYPNTQVYPISLILKKLTYNWVIDTYNAARWTTAYLSLVWNWSQSCRHQFNVNKQAICHSILLTWTRLTLLILYRSPCDDSTLGWEYL